jgi:hypothetical protein
VDDYRKVDNIYGFIIGIDKTYLFLDKELKTQKNAEFNDYGSKMSLCSKVRNDYTNVDDVINAVTSRINSNGVGKYVIGEKPSANFSEPKDYYSSRNRVELKELFKAGFKYNVTYKAIFTQNLVSNRYDNGWVCFWNPDATLGTILISAITPCNWDATKNAKVIDAIKAKGFTVENTDADDSGFKVSTLKNNILTVLVYYSEKGSRELYVEIKN